VETSICVVGLEGLQLIRISLGGRMKVRRQDGHQAIAPAAICVVLLLVAPSAGKAQDNCVLDASEVRHGTQAIDAQFTDPDTLWRPKLGLPNNIQSITWSRDPALCAEALHHLHRVADSLGWRRYSRETEARVLVFIVEPELSVVIEHDDLDALTFFDRRWRYLVTLRLLS
jgi:hypothetical protein